MINKNVMHVFLNIIYIFTMQTVSNLIKIKTISLEFRHFLVLFMKSSKNLVISWITRYDYYLLLFCKLYFH